MSHIFFDELLEFFFDCQQRVWQYLPILFKPLEQIHSPCNEPIKVEFARVVNQNQCGSFLKYLTNCKLKELCCVQNHLCQFWTLFQGNFIL